MRKKRFGLIGTGVRCSMFINSILDDYQHCCELLAIADKNPTRAEYWKNHIAEKDGGDVKVYDGDGLEKMIAENKLDTVIVTTGPDCTHDEMICRVMDAGADVVCEKPMTTDVARIKKIVDKMNETGKKLQVTFNYRYAPPRSQIKELIMAGEIGEVLSVDFAWMLDTRHGADYFRRWHRMRENSGSLLVHKSTHHFDLVNWWLDDIPEEVFCEASRKFYTPANADARGLQGRGERCLDCGVKDKCNFYMDIDETEWHRELYHKAEDKDGYIRDRCVFAPEIDIWDNMGVSVKYSRGAILNYMLHAYSPYEGFSIAFNGTKGRIEHFCCENTYISGDGAIPGNLEKENVTITLIKEFEQPQEIEVRTGEGGHGGGDPVLLADIFDPEAPADPLKRKAGAYEGAYSIMCGIAAYESIDTGKRINVAELLNLDLPKSIDKWHD